MNLYLNINFFFFVLLLLTLVCSLSVILAKNPIHSILFLVLLFIISTILLLILEVEFLAMLFLVIYIGAIVVLFLFVVMMLNVRIIELDERMISYVPISLFIIGMFFILVFYIISKDFFNIVINFNNKNYTIAPFTDNSFIYFFNINNLLYLSQVLFGNYYYPFLLNGIILLIAMLGAIVLTLTNKIKSKYQNYYIQTNKDINKAIRHLK